VFIIRRINCINTTSRMCHSDRLVCRSERSFPTCILDGHLHRVTHTRCCIDTIDYPDDQHEVARNMLRTEINKQKKELGVKLVTYKNYTEMAARSTEHKKHDSFSNDFMLLFYSSFHQASKTPLFYSTSSHVTHNLNNTASTATKQIMLHRQHIIIKFPTMNTKPCFSSNPHKPPHV
jgi:hypothetical protein